MELTLLDAPARRPPETTRKRLSLKVKHGWNPLTGFVWCMSSLLISIGLLYISLYGLEAAAQRDLGQAVLYRDSLVNSTVREHLAQSRLETLTDTKLRRHFFEGHIECLARGISVADRHFLGRDYTEYPAIRNSTIAWVKENCDRLFYTPELSRRRQDTKSNSVWASISRRAKTIVGRLMSFWGYDRVNIDDQKNSTSSSRGVYSEPYVILPRHFRLLGCATPPCQLVYMPPKDLPLQPASPQKALVVAARRVSSLRTLVQRLDEGSSAVWRTYSPLAWAWLAATLPCVCIAVFQFHTERPYYDSDFVKCTPVLITVLGPIINFAANPPMLPVELSVVLFLLGLAGFLAFCVPNDTYPNFKLLFVAAKEFIGVLCGHYPSMPTTIEELGLVLSPTTTSRKRISPETTLKEDLSVTMEALREGAQYSGEDEDGDQDEDEEYGPEFQGWEHPLQKKKQEVGTRPSSRSSETHSEWSVVSCEQSQQDDVE